LIAYCVDEGLDEHLPDDDLSAVRVALQHGTVLVTDDETLQILMSAFGGGRCRRENFRRHAVCE
jgi:hypothetical protein